MRIILKVVLLAVPTQTASDSLTYSSLMESCQNKCTMVQSDKKKIQDASVIVEIMNKRFQNDLNLIAAFGRSSEILNDIPGDTLPGNQST